MDFVTVSALPDTVAFSAISLTADVEALSMFCSCRVLLSSSDVLSSTVLSEVSSSILDIMGAVSSFPLGIASAVCPVSPYITVSLIPYISSASD